VEQESYQDIGFNRADKDRNKISRRRGTTIEKLDAFVAVAPHGHVGQYMTRIAAWLKPML
jgi:hypothetical protein